MSYAKVSESDAIIDDGEEAWGNGPLPSSSLGESATPPGAVNTATSSATAAPGFLDGSKHKTAILFHFAFKILALLVYLLGGLFSDHFVIPFIACVLLLAFDFWTVKNVTGRLLVGLRWWSRVVDDGTNEWIYESAPAEYTPNKVDSRMFWIGIYITPLVWTLLGVMALSTLKLGWFISR
jgi:hypothetical protein